MKKIFFAAAMLMLCLVFSGCTFFETDTEALMTPPFFTEEQEKLNKALTEVIGETYTLKYPRNGETNSAFIFRDLDGNGTDEAMVFYSLLDESTRINVLKKEGDDWISVYTAPGFYGEIEMVDFVETKEKGLIIVIKWENEVGIYRYGDEKLESVRSTECEGVDIADINGDGCGEILVFSGSEINNRSTLNIICCDEDGNLSENEVSIHANYSDIFSRCTGKINDDEYAYFIDSQISEGIYLTEIITLDEEGARRRFIADFVEDEKEETEEQESGTIVVVGGDYGKRGIFLRNTKVFCMDTNGDGIIEMPVEFREDYARDPSSDIFYINYVQYDGTGYTPVWNGVPVVESGYLFAVPESWNEKISADYGSSDNEFVFREKSTGEVVLEIFCVSKTDYQDKYEDCVLAAENGTNNYYIKSEVPEDSEFHIAPGNYENAFIFI